MIEILQSELQMNENGDFWACWLQITQGPESWMLPATAPGTLVKADLQAYFDARETELWSLAQSKQYAVDLYERIPLKQLLKAFALVVLDEINILRQQHGLSTRTTDQLIQAIKIKLKQ